MAVTADVVQVVLEAEVNKYLSDLNKAGTGFENLTRRMNSEVRASGLAFSDLRVQATQAVTSTQAQVNRFNTANIAAQFQDIGVTAAAGMNPLIVALQQGTQLSAVLNAEVSKGANPVKALGAAFVQVLNPISLATIAAIALGVALIQGLGSVIPKAESATQAIKRHREELEKVVRGYEGAEDAVANYFDQVERLPQFAVTESLQKQFTELEKAATALPTRLQDVSDYVRALGSSATDTDREILSLVEQFQEGEITLEELYGELGTAAQGMGILESAAGKLGLGAAKTVADLRALILTVTQFGDEYARFLALTQINLGAAPVNEDLQNALDLKTYIAEQERLNGLTTEQLNLEKEIARIKSDAGELGITDQRARELAEQTLAAEERRAEIQRQLTAGGRSGDKAAREYDKERQAITDLLEAMGFEAALLGQTNREKAIAIALSKANATATQEELNAISQTAGFIYDTEQAIKNLNETSQEWANTIQSATRGFIDDLIEGKSAAEAFGNVLSDIGSRFIDLGLNSLFGGSGFNLAGLFGGTSTRATGGPVYAGNPTLVGERGPEVFVPSGPGRIVPNSQVGGSSVTFAPVIDARGADVAAVARLEQSMQRLAADIVPAIRREIATTGKKGRTRG